MKILIPVYIGGHGGASRQVIMLANNLVSRGYSVTMVALHYFNPSFFKIDTRINIINLTNLESNAKCPIFTRYKAYRKVLSNMHPDMTIHYNFQSVYFTVLSGVREHGKIIFAERGDPSNKSDYTILLRIIRSFVNPMIDGFVFQTRGAQKFFKKKIQNKSIVIPNSVAIKDGVYSKVTKREKTIVCVGRLHQQKNQILLIDAFAKIASKYPDYLLEFYGDGELREHLQCRIDTLGLTKKIILKGSVKNVFEYVRKSSLFVLSSDYEGMPNALMEAMALGVPCISTDCSPGGARDLIKDGVNGWITPIKDVKSLAEKMDYVLSNPLIAEQAATEAMKITKTHTDMRTFNMWDEFIKSIIKK